MNQNYCFFLHVKTTRHYTHTVQFILMQQHKALNYRFEITFHLNRVEGYINVFFNISPKTIASWYADFKKYNIFLAFAANLHPSRLFPQCTAPAPSSSVWFSVCLQSEGCTPPPAVSVRSIQVEVFSPPFFLSFFSPVFRLQLFYCIHWSEISLYCSTTARHTGLYQVQIHDSVYNKMYNKYTGQCTLTN